MNRGDWDDFDDAGWDPLAAPDPPSDMVAAQLADLFARLDELEERRHDHEWDDDGG